ncbi:MAG: sensor histidine kinase [Anaerolineaceae bacterium]|nr:sensor histidine kinase [Anaerolineaceae bacterium]
MSRRKWLGILLPLGLGLAGIALVLRVSVIDNLILLPVDFDVLILILGLSLAIFAALSLVVRETLDRMHQQSFEQAQRQAFAEHRRFLTRLDHELKNPLTAMRAGLGSLSLTLVDDKQQQLIKTIELEALRLSNLVNHLRKLSELEIVPLEIHAIPTQALFDEIMELERDAMAAGQRQFSLEPPPYWPTLIGDQDLLLLALHNLLDNALKYTHPGDQITIRVRTDGVDLTVQIEDTGMGIDDAELPLVWEELYRGQQVRAIPGNGVGLALVKAIIERHDGEIDLRSQPGKGTMVTVHLPLR